MKVIRFPASHPVLETMMSEWERESAEMRAWWDEASKYQEDVTARIAARRRGGDVVTARMQYSISLSIPMEARQEGERWIATVQGVTGSVDAPSREDAFRAAQALYLRDVAGKIERGESP